jgi:Spy/CpxP family protein refolding chaperone
MKTTLMTIVISFLVLAGSAMAQTDQPKAQPMPRWKNAKGANELKLTDQQKKDIQKIKFDLMQKQIDLRAKIAHARLDYGQLTSADSPDEDAIAGKIDEIAKLQVQLKKNLLDCWFVVNKILTPDQQKIWKKVLEHPRMAARRMMIRMRTNGRNGFNGMMQWRKPGVGMGSTMGGGPVPGEGLENNANVGDLDDLGSLGDTDMFFSEIDPLSDELEVFDEPMIDNSGMMEQGEFMRNRAEIMKKMMDQNMPEPPAPDSSQ